jgi:hypothetical protein
MSFNCPRCSIPLDTEGGLKRHMTRKHGGYNSDEIVSAGGEPSGKDIARSIDGHVSIDSVVADAPESETIKKDKAAEKREQKKSEKEREEFLRLRPQLVNRWKRRLRIPYSLWARLTDDQDIKLSEQELTEGAELHVDFCDAMGWFRAGKIEAIMDLGMWHGATILSRSKTGKSLLNSFKEKPDESTTTNS